MPHSHLSVQHFLKQVDLHHQQKRLRDQRPAWLVELINEIAAVFEPDEDIARAGFDCRFINDQWVADLFLGEKEIVGGPRDGERRRVGFRFDLNELLDRFDHVDRFDWRNRMAGPTDERPGQCCSYVSIAGRIGEQHCEVNIYAAPPLPVEPALKDHTGGRLQPVPFELSEER